MRPQLVCRVTDLARTGRQDDHRHRKKLKNLIYLALSSVYVNRSCSTRLMPEKLAGHQSYISNRHLDGNQKLCVKLNIWCGALEY